MAPLLAIILAAPLLELPLAYDRVLRKVITLLIIAAGLVVGAARRKKSAGQDMPYF